MVKAIRAAMCFLTRIPVSNPGDFTAADVARASSVFPLLGALIGLAQVGFTFTLPASFPPALVGTILVGLAAVITGALHLDGLTDTFDGLGAQVERAERLRIMRDPHVGAFGVTALVIILAIKSITLATLFERHQLRALISAAAIARFCPVLLARVLPPARSSGLGRALSDHLSNKDLAGAALIAVLVAALTRTGWRAVFGALISACAIGYVAHRQLGGVTGDILGASIELAEAAALVASVV